VCLFPPAPPWRVSRQLFFTFNYLNCCLIFVSRVVWPCILLSTILMNMPPPFSVYVGLAVFVCDYTSQCSSTGVCRDNMRSNMSHLSPFCHLVGICCCFFILLLLLWPFLFIFVRYRKESFKSRCIRCRTVSLIMCVHPEMLLNCFLNVMRNIKRIYRWLSL
jgi:hypothetical protein